MTTLVVVFEDDGHPPRGHLLVPGQEQVGFHGWLTLLGSMEAALARRDVAVARRPVGPAPVSGGHGERGDGRVSTA